MIDVIIFTPETHPNDTNIPKPTGIDITNGKFSERGYCITPRSITDRIEDFSGLICRTITDEQWDEVQRCDLPNVGRFIKKLLVDTVRG